MKANTLTISKTAQILGVSIQTLRRWDDSGRLPSIRREAAGHRHYSKGAVEDFVRNNLHHLSLLKMAWNWARDGKGTEPLSDFYCPDISVFQARLTRLERELGSIKRVSRIFPLIVAITGEIGNNSFDHNLGNWPDVLGTFFAYNIQKGNIVLADRGQGILATLQNAKPELANHQEALRTAFSEVISGRAPEYRGNGLKFVRDVVASNNTRLFFQTGDARLNIQKNNSSVNIKKTAEGLRGCLALISF